MDCVSRMGKRYFDQYSLIHASTGVISYFWSLSFVFSFLLHTIFELTENTKQGMYIINNYFMFNGVIGWPGGKPEPDSVQNMIGDSIAFAVGWIISFILDFYGKKYNWYNV